MSGGTGHLALSDGRELSTVKFVGAVRSVDEQSTHVRYEVEDGTGLITVQQYIDDATESTFTRNMRDKTTTTEHCYVRVIGQVKDYDNRKNVVGFSVRLLSTGNELTHHMLEVVHSGERCKKITRGGGGASTMNPYGTNMSMSSPQPVKLDYSMQQQPPQYQQQHSLNNAENGNNQGLHDSVLSFIQNQGDKAEVGADLNECIKTLAGKFSEAEVRKSIDHLSSEGHIYSTINETKFKYAM